MKATLFAAAAVVLSASSAFAAPGVYDARTGNVANQPSAATVTVHANEVFSSRELLNVRVSGNDAVTVTAPYAETANTNIER